MRFKLSFLIKINFVIYIFGLYLFLNKLFDTEIDKNHSKAPNPCENVAKVNSFGNRIQIQFKQAIKTQNPYELASHFSYNATVYDIPIHFPPNIEINASYINENTLEIVLPFPFIHKYRGKMLCSDKNNKKVYKKFPLKVYLQNFQENVFTSQLKCFGESKEDRVCKATNISVKGSKIYLISKAEFVLSDHFLNLGSRNPIFVSDPQELNIYTNIIDSEDISAIDAIKSDTQLFIFSDGNLIENKLFFNKITDVYIPIYLTYNKYHEEGKKHIFVNTKCDFDIDTMLNIITNNSSTNIFPNKFNVIVENAVLGLEKVDKNNKYEFKDQFSGDSWNFDDFAMRKFFNSSEVKKGSITILNPIDDQKIIGIDKFSEFLKNKCPSCDIKCYNYDPTYPLSVLNRIYETNVLIGRSLYGTEHSLFMNKGTAVVDLINVNMECDKRPQKFAEIAGVDYYQNVAYYVYEGDNCNLKGCESYNCYKFGRDSYIEINQEDFENIWEKIRNYL